MSAITETSLTPAQRELLKILARPMSEEELIALKKHIALFFAERLIQKADEIWENNNWSKKDTTKLRRRHLRTTYK